MVSTNYASLGLIVLSLGTGTTAFDFGQFETECVAEKTTTDNSALYECAKFNTDGKPFGDTEKQTDLVQMCSGDEAYLTDLQLSITNKLFGGEGRDGKLTASDCTSSCVYSMSNRGIPQTHDRTQQGVGYFAYHWKGDDQCWERVGADWCLNQYEIMRYWDMSAPSALAWTFPAFKVHHFCNPSQSPTAAPVMDMGSPATPEALPATPEDCVPTNGYNCPQRFLLGFCDMSEAIRNDFEAKCPNCCAPAPAEEGADTPAEEGADTLVVERKFSVGAFTVAAAAPLSAAPPSQDAGSDAAAAP